MNARLPGLLAAIAAAFLGWVPSARASIFPVTINNYSFETPYAGPTPAAYITGTPTGWSSTGTSGVEYYPGHTPVGDQFGWFFGNTTDPGPQTLYQGTPAALTNGDEYQLTAYLAADSIPGNVNSTAALYAGDPTAGGALLASQTVVFTGAAPQDFTLVTVTFGPDSPTYAALVAAHPAASIYVAFISASSTGNSTDVDGVQLLEIVPEPASLGFLACGSLLMLRRRR